MSHQEKQPQNDLFRERIATQISDQELSLDTDFRDQHFLVSARAVHALVESAGITESDSVLEIGPGLGQITEILTEEAGMVFAIEIDERFKPALDRIIQERENVVIVYANALDVSWPKVDKLVANIPFSILEPFLERLIKEKNIKQCSLVVGRNFYLRATDPKLPFSRTGFLASTFFDIQLVSELGPSDFFPQSDDKAVIVSLKREKCRDFGRTLLASRMMRCPKHTVYSLLSDLINESYDRHRDDPRDILSLKSLKVPKFLLKKRLNEINNTDINALAGIIRRFDRSERSQRQNKKVK